MIKLRIGPILFGLASAEFSVEYGEMASMTTEKITAEVSLTDAAVEAFRDITAQKGDQNVAMKLAVGPGGCGGYEYLLGIARRPKASDLLSESKGVALYLDSNTLHLFNGCTIDFSDGLMGEGFSVSNPRAKADCACGQSFKIAGEGGVDSGACTSSVAGRT